jgi:hypothetical protein
MLERSESRIFSYEKRIVNNVTNYQTSEIDFGDGT